MKTIDFSKLKNPKQAIGMAMKHFPEGSVDGSIINKILGEFI